MVSVMSPVVDAQALLPVGLILFVLGCDALPALPPWDWPIHYNHVDDRPPLSPSCQPGDLPFCAAGRQHNSVPLLKDDDTLYVYAMTAPVWDYDELLEKQTIMHEAIGFHHVQSGTNFTMEWYQMCDLFNASFPRVLANDSLLWCNQGAACIQNGIDKSHWEQNGTIIEVAEISGETFRFLADWVEDDNNSAVYYQMWNIKSPPGHLGSWFKPWDGANWFHRAFLTLQSLGTTIHHSDQFMYTQFNLYGNEPVMLGDAASVFNTSHNKELAKDILNFYEKVQSFDSMPKLIEAFLGNFTSVVADGHFYLYYNDLFWLVPLLPPYFDITYG